MKIKIHPLFYVLFLFAIIVGEVKSTSLFFIAVFTHDFAHYIVARYYGVKVKSLILLPLGCQMKMDDEYIGDNERINIYIAGPMINICFSIILFLLKKNGLNFSLYNEVIFSHICIGFINLLPFHPMDGSIVVKILLSKFMGNIRASKIIIIVTKFSGVILVVLTIYSIWNHLYNINFGIIGVFLLYQSYKEDKSLIAQALRQDLIKRNKVIAKNQTIKCERICTTDKTKLKELMHSFHVKKYYIIEVIDENYNHVTTLTEEDVLNGIINLGYDCAIKDILVK